MCNHLCTSQSQGHGQWRFVTEMCCTDLRFQVWGPEGVEHLGISRNRDFLWKLFQQRVLVFWGIRRGPEW